MSKDKEQLIANQLSYAKLLCEGSDNTEYIRGIAELLAQFVPTSEDTTQEEDTQIITEMIS